ncbi:MAG: hypothetical protein A2Y14_05900 [Verrucomicrobia bacterium GWF2_51_19]|nr:MAG: hypothetical protein A2Y14_05900 [Verrucomicrobia bacterium GWF2_51_19]HCJ12183.1 hypothetical protein [Opitutae bacterium]
MKKLWFLACLFLLGCQHTAKTPTQAYSFHMEASPFFPKEWTHAFKTPESDVEYAVHTETLFDSNDIAAINPIHTENGAALLFSLPEGSQIKLLKLTAQNVGKKLLLIEKDKVVGFHFVEKPIGDGKLVVYMEVPDEQIQQWAQSH